MALSLSDLQAARDRLVTARLNGVSVFVDQNGERIEYKTDAQMAAALAALDAEIAQAGGRQAPRTVVFRTSKGNFVQRGDAITVTADATSGQVVKVGNLIGVAAGDAATGEDLVLNTLGVFELPKVAADVLAIGDPIYWRSSDGLVTGTASGNSKLGVAVSDAGAGSSSVRVRLNGSF